MNFSEVIEKRLSGDITTKEIVLFSVKNCAIHNYENKTFCDSVEFTLITALYLFENCSEALEDIEKIGNSIEDTLINIKDFIAKSDRDSLCIDEMDKGYVRHWLLRRSLSDNEVNNKIIYYHIHRLFSTGGLEKYAELHSMLPLRKACLLILGVREEEVSDFKEYISGIQIDSQSDNDIYEILQHLLDKITNSANELYVKIKNYILTTAENRTLDGTDYVSLVSCLSWAKEKGYTLPEYLERWHTEQFQLRATTRDTIRNQQSMPVVIIPKEMRARSFEEVCQYLMKTQYPDIAKAYTLNKIFPRAKGKIGLFLSGKATGDLSAKIKCVNKLLKEAQDKGYSLGE